MPLIFMYEPINIRLFQKGASFSHISLFNKLPPNLKSLSHENTKHFKHKLKSLPKAHSFYSLDTFLLCGIGD